MMSEKIRVMLAKKDVSKAWLAGQLGWSTSNLYNKLKRDNWSEKELQEIAAVLQCSYDANFIMNDTNERI